MGINVLLAMTGGLGVFLITLSMKAKIRTKKVNAVDRVKGLMNEEQVYENLSFFQVARKYGFSSALIQADLDVTPAGFWRTGLILAVISSLVAYTITQGPVALFVGFLSLGLYLNWLFSRREKRRMEFDEALTTVADAISSGASLHNTVKDAIRHSVMLSPMIMRDDLSSVSSSLIQGASVSESFRPIQEKRKSFALDLLVETLITWESKGTSISLEKALEPLSMTVREMSSTRKKCESELTATKYQMYIVAVFPLFMVLFIRTIMPGYDDAFRTPIGQALQLVSYTISGIGFILCDNILKKVRKTMDIETCIENILDD